MMGSFRVSPANRREMARLQSPASFGIWSGCLRIAITTVGLGVVLQTVSPIVADDSRVGCNGKVDRLVEAVVNRNEEPEYLEGDESITLFCKQYDWNEHRRVQAAIRTLSQDGSDELWGVLVKHFGDKRYSFCIGQQRLWARSWSVGDVCLELAHAQLLCAYLRHLEPGRTEPMGGDSHNSVPPGTTEFLPQRLQLTLHNPPHLAGPIIRDSTERARFERWCQTKKGALLFHLQIEMCQWAIETVERDLGAAEKPKRQFVQAVRSQIEALEHTKKPVIDHSDFASPVCRGLVYPFNEREAKKGWNRHEELKTRDKENQTPACNRNGTRDSKRGHH